MTYLEWQPSAHETINGMLNLMVEKSGYTLEQLRAHNRSVSLVRARRIIAKKMFAERFTKAQIGRFLQRDATVIGGYLGGRRASVVNEGVGA